MNCSSPTCREPPFTASDVVELYLHRGAFEPQLSGEDQEIDPDRWCSHSAEGQETWQIVAQWIWNVRLELGHQLHPDPVRTTEFAPARSETNEQQSCTCGYGKPAEAFAFKADRFSGLDFALQPDGALRCPANQKLIPNARRREADGSLRVVYAASIRSCRPCSLRDQCQWNGRTTAKPRQESRLLHPVVVDSAPVLWRDWSRRVHRHACMQLLRQQRVEVTLPEVCSPPQEKAPTALSRAARAHARLCWTERLECNARAPSAYRISIHLFGVPDAFAVFLGRAIA